MSRLLEPALFTRLRGARRVLVAGAGGGFDVYAGLPLALALREDGKEVRLANLSFCDLHGLDLDVWPAPDVAAVRPDTRARGTYFPERTLARWLDANGLPSTVHAFDRTGVVPLRAAYRALTDHLGGVDAIVLVDGGTDILMRGDEHGLGTPEEDMASLAAANAPPEVPQRLVACLGFGIDAHHGVNHTLVPLFSAGSPPGSPRASPGRYPHGSPAENERGGRCGCPPRESCTPRSPRGASREFRSEPECPAAARRPRSGRRPGHGITGHPLDAPDQRCQHHAHRCLRKRPGTPTPVGRRCLRNHRCDTTTDQHS